MEQQMTNVPCSKYNTMEGKKQMEAKYIFTDEKLELDDGTILHRVEALKDFSNVKKGDRSGWIEHPENLSQYGNAWETSPLQIQSTHYFVNMATATELQIGCQRHTLEWWLANNEAHAAEEGDTPEYAAEVRLYIELACKRYAPELLENKQ